MSKTSRPAARGGRGVVRTAALLGLGYLATRWYRHGRVTPDGAPAPRLDRYMPAYEVRESHATRVAAPAAVTYGAARELDIHRSPIVRAIFRGRELLLRNTRPGARAPREPLLQQVLRLGWRVLEEDPGREIVLGAVTRPWEADVRFRGVPPSDFLSFDVPGYAKIIWNISVEPVGPAESLFRTETRVAATDAYARERFRRYWSRVSPGVVLIRRQILRLVRAEAERRHRAATEGQRTPAVEG